MASRYDNRSYSRGESQFGRRSESDYSRPYGDQSQKRYRYDEDDDQTSGREDRWNRDYSTRYSSTGRDYQEGRDDYRNRSWNTENDYSAGERDREYGGYGSDIRYGRSAGGYSPRYNSSSGYRSGETYGSYGERDRDYNYGGGSRGAYSSESGGYRYGSGYGTGRGYEDERYRRGDERGWWDRTSDEVASWFGDEEADRRRQMDRQRAELRGRGPKNYRRSDERIKEDVNDRLSDGYLDASDIEVAVSNSEVTLTGSVYSRSDKRRAEDIAESVSGVTNVENRLRVTRSALDRNTGTENTGTTTGITGTSTTSSATTGATSRSRGAGN